MKSDSSRSARLLLSDSLARDPNGTSAETSPGTGVRREKGKTMRFDHCDTADQRLGDRLLTCLFGHTDGDERGAAAMRDEASARIPGEPA